MHVLIDTHAHMHETTYEHELRDILNRGAEEYSVRGVLTIGVDLATSKHALKLCEDHRELKAAVGIHPNYTHQAHPDDWEQICKLASDPQVLCHWRNRA